MTNELLPSAFALQHEIEHDGSLARLNSFLIDHFHLSAKVANRRSTDYPALPLLLSFLDIAIERSQPLDSPARRNGSQWSVDDLRAVRRALEYTIFAVLEHRLQSVSGDAYVTLVQRCHETSTRLTVISLNYDIYADNALMEVAGRLATGATFPDYACDIRTPFYRSSPIFFHTLLKLHGSLNWLYCPGCHRLDLGIAPSGGRTTKVLEEIYRGSGKDRLDKRLSSRSSPCHDCRTPVRPVLITPTHRKDYRNPHIAHVWYRAERELRDADRVFIIGYSLPDDDLEVLYLLKRGLSRINPARITVVEYDTPKYRALADHPVGARYRCIFGPRLDWRPTGFTTWLESEPFALTATKPVARKEP